MKALGNVLGTMIGIGVLCTLPPAVAQAQNAQTIGWRGRLIAIGPLCGLRDQAWATRLRSALESDMAIYLPLEMHNLLFGGSIPLPTAAAMREAKTRVAAGEATGLKIYQILGHAACRELATPPMLKIADDAIAALSDAAPVGEEPDDTDISNALKSTDRIQMMAEAAGEAEACHMRHYEPPKSDRDPGEIANMIINSIKDDKPGGLQNADITSLTDELHFTGFHAATLSRALCIQLKGSDRLRDLDEAAERNRRDPDAWMRLIKPDAPAPTE